LFNVKARLWVKGRKRLMERIESCRLGDKKIIWIHCSSLGEFEQGRPVIEDVKKRRKDYEVLLTFFSPSGYEVRKNYPLADYVYYLPLDSESSAKRFIDHFKPDVAVFVKYEFWYFFIRELYSRNIPVYLVSAVFRPSQVFFRSWGGWFRNILKMFTHLFVQNTASEKLLKDKGIERVTVCGDTRFDRVSAIASKSEEIPLARAFSAGKNVLVAGSTWRADEEMLVGYINNSDDETGFIIAPHETSAENIERIEKRLKKPFARFSHARKDTAKSYSVLIVDSVGMLSFLYKYGQVAYVGGGFGIGIHNILEAAVYGMPVIFGPSYGKFAEAVELARLGGAFPVNNSAELKSLLDKFFSDRTALNKASEISRSFVQSGEGATKIITDTIFPDSGT